MPARTGDQFLKGLRGPREIWVDGERVSDVVDHPKLEAWYAKVAKLPPLAETVPVG